MTSPLRIALASAECVPFAKTGGLADVTGALASALWKRGHDVRLFVPYYRSIDASGLETHDGHAPFSLEFPGRSVALESRTAPLPHSDDGRRGPLQVEFINAPDLFDRESFYTDDGDEPVRWAGFCRGAIELCQRTGWAPDVFHVNDWHTSLIPLLLQSRYAWDELLQPTRTLLSIHNLGYQGAFPADAIDPMGLSDQRDLFHQDRLAQGAINFLETGILYSSWLSTVSDTYAREIQTEENGAGLDGLLAQRSDHLVGIVNGIDPEEWNPRTDPHIPATFGPDDLAGKRVCRDELLNEMGVAPNPSGPVLGIVSRMTWQKGFELFPEVLSIVLRNEDVRLVVLGSGDSSYENYFRWLREKLPSKVGLKIGYDNGLSHRIEAGSDVFLMPSRYEPCGLNQMYSLRYGTVPLVRATGGLADTVERFRSASETGSEDQGTGFVFYDFSAEGLHGALSHALDVWRDQDAWRRLQLRGMGRDFSWDAQVRRYEDLYAAVMAEMRDH
ncbi:MAG: glycogen synthase [Planctomycetota bacterium]